MSINHVKRAFGILREHGVLELSKQSKEFVKRRFIDEFLFKFNTIKNRQSNLFCYDKPPNAKNPIHIDPNRIEYSRRGFLTPSIGLGKIKRGNWDDKTNLDPIKNDNTITGIRQRFQEKRAWEETVYYEKFKSKYNGDEDKVRERCAYVDSLYHDIKSEGYKPASAADNKRQRSGYGQSLEVLVVIDRDGRIYHQGKGSHRLGISRVLDINIPVQVLVRHERWQKLRDDIYNNGLSDEYKNKRDHPDLQDILE